MYQFLAMATLAATWGITANAIFEKPISSIVAVTGGIFIGLVFWLHRNDE